MWKWKRAKETISGMSQSVPIELARKHSRILLVDDDPEALPLSLLKDEGYNITQWEELDADKIRRVEQGEFDVVILDIVGVAPKNVSATDGFGVLEHIKRVNPEQVVIAFSGETFDIKQAGFFEQADDRLLKPVDLVTVARMLDDVLQQYYNLNHYWKAIHAILHDQGVPQSKIEMLERRLMQALASRQHPDPATIFSSVLNNAETAARIALLIGRAIEIYTKTSPQP